MRDIQRPTGRVSIETDLAVVGHSEGGSVAMLAATKEKRVGALALVATIGATEAPN